MIKAVQIIVQGKVQGVFFRASAKSEADKLGIKGIVKNLPNGNVYIEACGEENNLQEFISWCKSGPPNALVTNVDVREITDKEFDGFEITRNM